MISEFAKLALEIGGVLAVTVGVIVSLRRWRGRQVDTRSTAAAVLVVLTVVSTLAQLRDAGSVLNQARRHVVGARSGLEHCFEETNGEQGPRLPSRLPFINWVKQRLPAHAVYALAPYAGPPDSWCVAPVLLPSVPAGPDGHAAWTIAFGTMPSDLQARIARRDPSVRVFAPGFALAQDSSR